jgi:hypothetical protein
MESKISCARIQRFFYETGGAIRPLQAFIRKQKGHITKTQSCKGSNQEKRERKKIKLKREITTGSRSIDRTYEKALTHAYKGCEGSFVIFFILERIAFSKHGHVSR